MEGSTRVALTGSVAPRVPVSGATGSVSDAELLSRIAAGDHSAFELLYGRYAQAMLGLAVRRLGDRGLAEDAVQEAFASVWRAAASFRPERGQAVSWLFAVARNAVASRARRRSELVVAAPEVVSSEASPAEAAERAWVSWRVHRALEGLPRRERELIELAYWGDLSQSEIAERLGVPLGSVKTWTRRTLLRLAAVLEDQR